MTHLSSIPDKLKSFHHHLNLQDPAYSGIGEKDDQFPFHDELVTKATGRLLTLEYLKPTPLTGTIHLSPQPNRQKHNSRRVHPRYYAPLTSRG